MPRGGRRPGAGAPKRNFNALKTGKHSQRMYLLALYLLANLIKQGLSLNPDPRQPAPRGFIGVFVDGKCRCLYLAPKNKKIQSNFTFFIYTKNCGQEKTIIQPPQTDTITPSRAGKGPGVRSAQQTLQTQTSLSLSLSFCGKIIPAINLTGLR